MRVDKHANDLIYWQLTGWISDIGSLPNRTELVRVILFRLNSKVVRSRRNQVGAAPPLNTIKRYRFSMLRKSTGRFVSFTLKRKVHSTRVRKIPPPRDDQREYQREKHECGGKPAITQGTGQNCTSTRFKSNFHSLFPFPSLFHRIPVQDHSWMVHL